MDESLSLHDHSLCNLDSDTENNLIRECWVGGSLLSGLTSNCVIQSGIALAHRAVKFLVVLLKMLMSNSVNFTASGRRLLLDIQKASHSGKLSPVHRFLSM